MTLENHHYVLGRPLLPPFPDHTRQAIFGLGCFWGAEQRFWELAGVYTTAAGYSGGQTPHPCYEEVCTGLTGHNETVLVVYDETQLDYAELLKIFWESHNPTQGMRQGNDAGTQYRSGIYYFDATQETQARRSLECYQQALGQAGLGRISSEIKAAGEFYYAETYHQQYLAKNPGGYCGLGGTGIPFSPAPD